MFWHITLLSLPVAYISYKWLERAYPNKTKQFFIIQGWKAIQFCSYVEIKAIAAYKKVQAYFPEKKHNLEPIITIIKDHSEIDSYKVTDFLALKNNKDLPTYDCDFILYELPIVGNDKFSKCMMRYNDIDSIVKIEYNALNEIRFSAIRFNFKDSEEIISINFNDTQFLSQGNIVFDLAFLKWYMHKHHGIVLSDEDKYTITFIDHNMNYVILDENKHIVIKKNDYDIIDRNDKVSLEEPFTLL
jgi:hypothetical protein